MLPGKCADMTLMIWVCPMSFSLTGCVSWRTQSSGLPPPPVKTGPSTVQDTLRLPSFRTANGRSRGWRSVSETNPPTRALALASVCEAVATNGCVGRVAGA